MLKKIAALLLVPVLLAGCSAAGDVETLLRAPQLSGESAALQKALNNYLGGSATLKYPASGDFLSPFAFGDWDGDGTDEAAVLYTTDTTSSNGWLAVSRADGGEQPARQPRGGGPDQRGAELFPPRTSETRRASSCWQGMSRPRATNIWLSINMTVIRYLRSSARAIPT